MAGEELAKKLPNAFIVKAFVAVPASFIPHAIYRSAQLQRLVVFYCDDDQISKVVVHRLIGDCGFIGLDAGRLRMAKELVKLTLSPRYQSLVEDIIRRRGESPHRVLSVISAVFVW
jgi:predicted dinucleotide-binding enzyme